MLGFGCGWQGRGKREVAEDHRQRHLVHENEASSFLRPAVGVLGQKNRRVDDSPGDGNGEPRHADLGRGRARTRRAYELIVVDNASDAPTRELLQAYDQTAPYCMTLQQFIDFNLYVRCFTFGKTDITPVAYEPRERRYVIEHAYLSPEVGERVVRDAEREHLLLEWDLGIPEDAPAEA